MEFLNAQTCDQLKEMSKHGKRKTKIIQKECHGNNNLLPKKSRPGPNLTPENIAKSSRPF